MTLSKQMEALSDAVSKLQEAVDNEEEFAIVDPLVEDCQRVVLELRQLILQSVLRQREGEIMGEPTLYGFRRHTNPSGEVIRRKTYVRICPAWDNESVESLYQRRKALADLLQMPADDLMADLTVTVRIDRYPKHERRFQQQKNERKEEKLMEKKSLASIEEYDVKTDLKEK